MDQIEFSWKTDDGLNIYAKEWSHESPEAVVLLVHGLGEHTNRYEEMAAYFQQNGLAFIGNDHRGHGQSDGKRGHCRSRMDFFQEIRELIKRSEEKYPGCPIFLYGHSMGGTIGLSFTLMETHPLKGMLVSGPWIQLPKKSEPSKFFLFMLRVIRAIAPGLSQSNGLDSKFISTDPKEVEKYLNDPLVHDQITVRQVLEIFTFAQYLNAFSSKTPVPLLLMHGEKDEITAAKGTREFSERVKENTELEIWPESYHEIHYEPNRQEVFDRSIAWIKKNGKN